MSLRIWLILAEAVSLPDFSTDDADLAGHHHASRRRPGRRRPSRPGSTRRSGRAGRSSPCPSTITPSTGHDLAGVDDDDVAGLEPVERDLDLDAVAIEPDEPRLLAEGVQEQLLRVVLRLLDQHPAEARGTSRAPRPGRSTSSPGSRPPRSRRARRPPAASPRRGRRWRFLERGDRRVGEQHRRDRQQRRAPRTGRSPPAGPRACRSAGGGRACPCASGCSACRQGAVEDLDDLVAGQLPWGRTGPGRCWSAGWSCTLSTPRTLISSRSMAWQRSLLR